jgi:Zn-dependent protease
VEAVNPGIFEGAASVLSIMFSLNLILFIFNLIPVPPLDGSGIIPLYLSEETGRKYMHAVGNSAFALIGLLIAWMLFDFIYFDIHTIFINLLYPGSNYQ